MDIESLKTRIIGLVEDSGDELFDLCRHMYDHPETGLKEYATSALLTAFLEERGFVVERGVAGMETAFRAVYGDGSPSIAILAEMDALPVLGHACGHNIIAAAALGAAVALRRAVSPDAARIIVLGTPAEEIGVGKVDMARLGIFEGIDAAMMVHPSSRRQVIKQTLGLAKLRFSFSGVAAHAAAYPEEGVNALDAVIQTFNGINALRQQLRQDVRVHGIITEGGAAPNIIPAKASCYFYVRAGDLDELERVRERVIACAEGAARATGCGLTIERDARVMAPLRVNYALSGIYSRQLALMGLAESDAPGDKNRGSSDIGNVSQVVPTIHPHVPVAPGLRIHTEEFARATVSEKGRAAMLEGAKALALTAAELVYSPALLREVKEEFNKSQ